MFKITFNKSFLFSLNNSNPATLIMPWLFGFTYNWCNTALKKQSPAPPTSSAIIPKWCNLSSKMFIAGSLTLHLFSHALLDLGSTPHQQMDLTVDPVYRWRYKFSQIDSVRLRCTMSSNVDERRLRQNIEHLKPRQDIEHVSLDRFQRDYKSWEK